MRGVVLCAGAGVLAAGLVWGLLPATVFKARALVGVVPGIDMRGPTPAIPADQFSPAVLRRIGERLAAGSPDGASDRTIERALSAVPGDVAGTLQVFAAAPSAARAALMATVAADAIVAHQDEAAHRSRMQRDARESSALARLQAQAGAAHRRLNEFGVGVDDPQELLAAAKVRAANARARVATIRAIMTAGSPPLSDRSDVPAVLKTLQFTYLDLMGQLARARETLGDRHSTIVALAAQVKKAAGKLTAEWQRLSQAADNEVTVSRNRLDALTKSMRSVDPAQAEAIAAARQDARKADDDLARGPRHQEGTPPDEATYRIVTPAGTPTIAQGIPLIFRLLLSGIAGLLAFAAGLRLPRRPVRRDMSDDLPRPAVNASLWSEASATISIGEEDTPADSSRPDAEDPSGDEAQAHPPVTTIMVAANELLARTTSVALTIGRAAAAEGVRVLIVETPRPVPTLASAADSIDPIIVDLYGMLRIALPADEDGLYIVPSLAGGERIAAELTRRGETPMIEDIAADFDLIVIDGGCAAESADAWRADVYLRVGPSISRMADALFAATFDIPKSALLDTVVLEEPEPSLEAAPIAPQAAPPVRPEGPVVVALPSHLQPNHLATRRHVKSRHLSYGRR